MATAGNPAPEELLDNPVDDVKEPVAEPAVSADPDPDPDPAEENDVIDSLEENDVIDSLEENDVIDSLEENDEIEPEEEGDHPESESEPEEEEDEEEDPEEEVDEGEEGGEDPSEGTELSLDSLDKPALVELLARLMQEKTVQTLRRDVDAIKVAFYKLHRTEVEAARKAWIEAGGDPEAFEPAVDPDEVRLKDLIARYRVSRDEHLATLESRREENLKAKLAIIEELKALVGTGETVGQTFNAFRELQQRWRDTGPVPLSSVRDLWNTYNHHVENFYSYVKINKELRDLDLRRNHEAKLALCEEAEALLLEPSVITAFHRLQKLHDQWREVGPVAAEHKEAVWERFREASGRINRQHQSHFDEVKEEQKKNLDLKSELCEQIEALVAEPRTARKEWDKASERLLEMQKVWKTIGFAPKKSNTKVYERFRVACDSFFEAKRSYYNRLKSEMELNLELKNEICAAAESLAGSDDWRGAGDELIALQKRWKEIGPVPRRNSDAVWKRFRAACDAFFERKSSHFSDVEGDYKENLTRKRALLAAATEKGFDGLTFEDIKEFQRKWSEVGYVPIKQKESIAAQYKDTVDKMFAALRGGEQQRSMDKFKTRVTNLKTSGDKRLRFERERLYAKVKQLESDIATLENNIGFFSNSKNAETMIAGVREKIERARVEMAQIIEKINHIDKEQE